MEAGRGSSKDASLEFLALSGGGWHAWPSLARQTVVGGGRYINFLLSLLLLQGQGSCDASRD